MNFKLENQKSKIKLRSQLNESAKQPARSLSKNYGDTPKTPEYKTDYIWRVSSIQGCNIKEKQRKGS